MLDLLASLADTPIPNILVIAGIVFLLLALAGKLGANVSIPADRQKMAAVVGVFLLVSGIAMYAVPRTVDGQQNQSSEPQPITDGGISSNDISAPSTQDPNSETLAAERVNLGRITFLTDEAGAMQPLAGYLEEHGAEISFLPTENLARLPTTRPTVVIVGPDTKGFWKTMSPMVSEQMFASHRVIGMGEGGTELFQVLGLELSGVMHGLDPSVSVELAEILEKPLVVDVPGTVVEVFDLARSMIGLYDGGSPTIAGFEGIGRWEGGQNHWPIARQGNYVLWGFLASTGQMTDDGKSLFVNLLVNHLQRPSVPLARARRTIEYVSPGIIADRLSQQFRTHEWSFQVRNAGRIEATLTWEPPSHRLALILNGPGQDGYYAREDGASPITINFLVEAEHLTKGSDWRVSAMTFENLRSTTVEYNLRLEYPE